MGVKLYLIFAINGILAWSIRGQLGGWVGGFAAGFLLSVAFLTFIRPNLKVHGLNKIGVLLSAIGFMWGGEISYGREFNLLATSLPDSQILAIIFCKLFLFGAAWGGIGGLGMGYLIKEKIQTNDCVVFILMNLVWLVTLWTGFGRFIWISFILTTILFWIGTSKHNSFKAIATFSKILAFAAGGGFLISGVFLLLSQMVYSESLREAFKLRDQILGIFIGTGSLFAQVIARQGRSNLRTQIALLPSEARNDGARLSYALLICILTALAIAKEAVPKWPNKWEWSYTLMIIACGILTTELFQRKSTLRKPFS